MKMEELREEINIEIEMMEELIREILSLRRDVAGREPTMRENAAAATFLAQFYTGVENIFKRISHFYSIPLPIGDSWHVDLFKRFCVPSFTPLPALLDEPLATAMASFRKFRHVVYHGYSTQLDWSRMREGMESVEAVFLRFKAKLIDYLQKLESHKA